MKFSYNWLESYFNNKLPEPKRLAELLTMRNFETEHHRSIQNKERPILDIDILPNRAPDCASHKGIAREISAVTGLTIKEDKEVLSESNKIKVDDFVSIKIEEKGSCQRYTLMVINGIKVAPSPKWIQERLEDCGLRPINNIVDIANYIMLETGQPLHAFDFEKIGGQNVKDIIVRRAKKEEKITTLDDKIFSLDSDILVIADLEGPLAIAGIKGGKRAEIDEETKIIVLEAANFDSVSIRKASRKLGLKTDASWRFEHKIDTNLTEEAIKKAVSLIKEIAGGEVAKGMIDFYSEKSFPKKVNLNLDYAENLLGVKIPEEKAISILKSLDFKIRKISSSPTIIEAIVPTFRLDVNLEEDLIEEIGRIYGFENIPSIFPVASLIPPKRNFDIFWKNEVKDNLKGIGFSEVYNYSFISEKQSEVFGYQKEELIEIENPISDEQKYLRPSLAPNLLKNVKDNFKYFDKIQIFEIGKIFQGENNNREVEEKREISGLIARKDKGREEFYRLKGAIDSLLKKLGISDIVYEDKNNNNILEFFKSAVIKANQQEIGAIGEISEKLLNDFNIPGEIVLFSIDFEKLSHLCSEEQEYQPISPYPSAVRDIAILVPLEVKVAQIMNKINLTGGEVVRDVDLFDIYEGEGLPAGKKSLAFHLIYQAENRTLTSEEIDRVQGKIIKELEKEEGWKVRK